MTENRGRAGRDRFNLFDGGENDNGTGRDGKMKTSKAGGTGQRVHNFSTGRDGKTTGQIFTTGSDGKCFFLRRDGRLNGFLLGGT